MNITEMNYEVKYNACASIDSPFAWYALRTKSNHEKLAAMFLQAHSFETFLPLYRAPRRRQDGGTETTLPLFSGYLFCRFDARYRSPVLGALGVVAIVAFGSKPARIDDMEIEAIRKALGSGQQMEPHPYLHEGQKVRIQRGPLQGLEGILVKKRTWRMVISVEMLRRAVSVEIDPDSIAPTERCDARTHAAPRAGDMGQCGRPAYNQSSTMWMEARSSALAGV